MRPLTLTSAVWLAACSASLPEVGPDAWLADTGVDPVPASDATRARTARVRTPFVDGAFTPAALHTSPERVLPLFEDLVIDATLDHVSVTDRYTTWVGHVTGWPEHEVVLHRTRGGLVSGIVRAPEATVRLRPDGPGQVIVEEVGLRIGDVDAEPVLPTHLPVFDAVPWSGPEETGFDGAPIIDVLIAATDPVGANLGGEEALESTAQALIAQANKGYADSGMATRLRLAGVHVSDWDEDGFAWVEALGSLAAPTDGTLDDVLEARDEIGADVVSLLVDGDGGACGLAYLMSPARPSFAAAAVSLVDARCASSNLSFTHEIGHNLGLHHDRANAVGTPATPTAYGYRDPDAAFRTVMAYDCAGEGCPRLNLWSTPDVEVEGAPAGVPASREDAAHNVLAVSLTGSVVAAFRDPPADPEPNAAASIVTPASGSTLTGSTVAVVWEDVGADAYTLTIGSEEGGADLARIDVEEANYTVVPGLPTDGRTLHATLWSDFDGELVSTTTTWTAMRSPPAVASLITPTPSTLLGDTTVRFAWEDVDADGYALVLGSGRFGSDLGSFTTTSTELTISGLPDDGRTIWASLHTQTGGVWRSETVTYQAFDRDMDAREPAHLLEPAPGSTLRGATLGLRWTDPRAERYALTLWSGETDVYHEIVRGTAAEVALPPSVPPGPLTIRLATDFDGRWFARSYDFTLE